MDVKWDIEGYRGVKMTNGIQYSFNGWAALMAVF